VPHANRHELGPIGAEVLLNRWLLTSKFHGKAGIRRMRALGFRRKVTDRLPGWATPTRFERHDPEVEERIAARFDEETGVTAPL
jgi:hypothetical protein